MSHPLRPLLPHPSTAGSKSNSPPRTKRVATIAACEACRRRKSKCSGERPQCAICIERLTSCEYRTLPSETHLKAEKRRVSEIELRCQTYDEIFDIIRSRPDHDAIQILRQVRSSVDVQDVFYSVHEESSLLLHRVQKPEYRLQYEFPYLREMPSYLNQWHNPYLASLLFDNLSSASTEQAVSSDIRKDTEDETQKMYLVPYHTAELADPRLTHVNLSNWTNVSSDNSTLRSLLEVYFVFQFPFHPYFDKDIFLADLVAGSGRFCSHLLHGYSSAKSRAEHWMPDNLCYRFLAEARRLYDLEKSSPTITTVQAAALIHLEHYINGTDEVGRPYLRDSIAMAWELDIFNPDPDQSREWQTVAAMTSWGLFNWQALIAYHTFQPPLLPDPPRCLLTEQEIQHKELGVKYPLEQEPIRTFDGLVFKAVSDFRVILNDVAKGTFKSPRSSFEISYNEASFFRSLLTTWYDTLPDPLGPRNIALPCHLKLHMHYHVLLVSLFEPFEKMKPLDGEESPSVIIGHAKACFETLVRLYYLRHGFESHDITLLQFLPTLAFSSLRDLRTEVDGDSAAAQEQIRSTIVLCAKGLWDQGRNSFASQALFRLYVESLGPAEAQLVKEAVEARFTDDVMDVVVREVRCRWPIGIFSDNKANRFSTLNEFVRWWEQDGRDRTMTEETADGSTSMSVAS